MAADLASTALEPGYAGRAALRTSLGICLASRSPTLIAWGQELSTLANDAYAQLFGTKQPSPPEPIDDVLRAVMETGEASCFDDQLVVVERNGFSEEAYFSWSCSPIADESGVLGVFAMVTETTARVLSERRIETLRQLGEQTSTARDSASACAAVIATLAKNPRCIPFAQLFLRDGDGRVYRLIAETGAAPPVERQWPIELACRTREVAITETAMVMPLAAGGCDHGALVVGFSPRLSFDAAYRDFLQLAADLVASALATAHAFDEQHRPTDTFYSISSKLVAELELERLLQLITDEATALVGAEYGVFGPTFHGDTVVRIDDVAVTPNSEPLPGMPPEHPPVRSYLAAPIVARSGEVIGGLFFGHSQPGMFGDRSERVLAAIAAQGAIAIDNARLYDQVRDLLESERQARHAAEEANRAKDEFLAVLGHELRNPLAPIQTALQLMTLRGDRQTKEREVLERQVGHLIRLVDDLLDVSRITRGKIELSKEKIELYAIVAEAIEMASPLFEQKRHRLLVSVPREGFMIDVDPGRLAQVVSNLLTNAAKYTPAGGEITLAASRCDREILLEVRDNGIGIPPESIGRVFEPFVQDKQALDRARGGLGLGLTIVRNFVQLHGGSVTVESAGTGKGSTFTVSLPAANIELAEDTQVTSPVPAPKLNVRRVLVVDDNIDAAELVVLTLSALGHHAEAAHDGPSALGVAERLRPHVALLDIGLPVMDGYELAKKLRELPELAEVRLVALTGYGTESDRARSLEAGFDEHLVKPLALDRLEAVLDVPAM